MFKGFVFIKLLVFNTTFNNMVVVSVNERDNLREEITDLLQVTDK
jgi:hypothetical protein